MANYSKIQSPPERTLYDKVTAYIREQLWQAKSANGGTSHKTRAAIKLAMMTLQKQLSSSPQAVARTLRKMIDHHPDNPDLAEQLVLTWDIERGRKVDAALEILAEYPGKFLIFTDYLPTMDALQVALKEAGHEVVVFHGGMSALKRAETVRAFRSSARVMISTCSGGEGHNLQFCHQMINYDLPWNPIRIEQRVGRLHRLGQKEAVTIFNLAAHDTIEAYILDLLAHKIGMHLLQGFSTRTSYCFRVTMRSFAETFFKHFGAEIRPHPEFPNELIVDLPLDLVDVFGKSRLYLVFPQPGTEPPDLSPNEDLVVYGSRTFDKMVAVLEGRGEAVHLRLPSRVAIVSEDNRPFPLSLENCRPKAHEAQLKQERFFIFNFRAVFSSDERQEDFITLILDNTGRPHPEMGTVLTTLAFDYLTEQSFEVSTETRRRMLTKAEAIIREQIADRVVELQGSIRPRLRYFFRISPDVCGD